MKKTGLQREFRGIGILTLIVMLFALAGPSAAQEKQPTFMEGLSMRITGNFQIQYNNYSRGDEDLKSGFSMRRARLGFRGEITPKINYRLQFDFTRDRYLLDALVELTYIPKARLSFGQFKIPFTLENITSSTGLDNINRANSVQTLCPGLDIRSAGRDIGLTVDGQFPFLEYQVGVFNGSGIDTMDTNDRKDLVGRLVLHPFDFVHLGVSHYEGHYSPTVDDPWVNRDRTGLELYLDGGRAFFKGEYIYAKDDQLRRSGWYIRGAYLFILEKLQGVFNYDSYDSDLDVTANRVKTTTLGLNFYLRRLTKLQVNYEHRKDDAAGTTENVILVQFQALF
ncbi:MAG: hypothetical protein KAU47_01015 [Candidatus Aminicenantes bacterium]|nr:hypothetical protein [Candidatus Aminicenantes bacterium]